MRIKRLFILFVMLLSLATASISQEVCNNTKYPDFSELYLKRDKLEKLNRKIFKFNLKLNNYFLKPIHVVWASIMPQYGMDRITNITKNIEYPIRLVSTLIQRDFQSAKTESIRFLTNTTLGLGGMFNPAETVFKLKAVNENMEQALAKCKMKQGTYMVMPVLACTTPRDMCGRLLDSIFNPSSYIGTPLIAVAKAIITINRTYFLQPLINLLETNFADTYDIAKKMYGLENFIKCANYDRLELIKDFKTIKQDKIQEFTNVNTIINQQEVLSENVLEGSANTTNIIFCPNNELDKIELIPDIILPDYKPQSPVIDSMRTVLFELSDNYKSIWTDLSVWNRNFNKSLHLASIKLYPNRPNYKYRYLLQKNPTSPIAVIYPSIGDSVKSSHASKFAKIFYEKGYSVLILSSHFNWEFANSMPENYFPGNPSTDVDYVKYTTDKIISELEQKHHYKFSSKTTFGTSFGALMTLFLAKKEFQPESNDKYLAVCPPIELVYAMAQVDKITEDWKTNPETIKEDIALTVEKVIQLANLDKKTKSTINSMPFTEREAKLITGFLLHQRLSDLIYLKTVPKPKQTQDLYKTISQTCYNDYARKYLIKDTSFEELKNTSNLQSLSSYLLNAQNYKIFHSLDDFLTNKTQLKQLKMLTGTKSVYFNNGSHLGFLYRKEFLDELKNSI